MSADNTSTCNFMTLLVSYCGNGTSWKQSWNQNIFLVISYMRFPRLHHIFLRTLSVLLNDGKSCSGFVA